MSKYRFLNIKYYIHDVDKPRDPHEKAFDR